MDLTQSLLPRYLWRPQLVRVKIPLTIPESKTQKQQQNNGVLNMRSKQPLKQETYNQVVISPATLSMPN